MKERRENRINVVVLAWLLFQIAAAATTSTPRSPSSSSSTTSTSSTTPSSPSSSSSSKGRVRNFEIDYENDRFVKDGETFRYISGSMHYFRTPREYWEDRVEKARACGLNVIQTYVAWNVHEPFAGIYDFSGNHDITGFLSLLYEKGMLVILRIGPFMDAEWDMGGLPYWLLKYPNIELRTSDTRYIEAVTTWYNVLLPKLVPYLYENGGPVIMMQIENEYGSYYACDRNYTTYLRDLVRSLVGDGVVLFTTDGDATYYLRCGVIPDVYATVDFGPEGNSSVTSSFNAQRSASPHGPLVNSEFYPGWLDLWGEGHAHTGISVIVETMGYMWERGASFNFYMFHGGTNYGFWAGAESGPYRSVTTSYDYDAPLSEAGDITEKYIAIRNAIQNLTGETNPYPIPASSTKYAYGDIKMYRLANVLELKSTLCPDEDRIVSTYPLTMEQIDHPFGFVMYESVLTTDGNVLDFATSVRDRAYVMVDGELIGTIDRDTGNHTLPIVAKSGAILDILVENRGRICYGRYINDTKGLVGNVTLDGVVIVNWTIYPFNFDNLLVMLDRVDLFEHSEPLGSLESLKSLEYSQHSQQQQQSQHVEYSEHLQRSQQASQQSQHVEDLSRFEHNEMKKTTRSWSSSQEKSSSSSGSIPSFYVGRLHPFPAIGDTYMNPSGWGKGQLFINRYNMGRYWPSEKPQVTLYVPGVFLSTYATVVMFELDTPGNCDIHGVCSVRFVDTPIFI